ncbi:CDC25-like phosphatase YCH1 [Golovinomyces cichoracearum]|uniref:CDC25-like phosphatase YCH1 n=1 Tax=Golovinomyces cichoracearum TaxID=62708 RepID=A0A420IWN8_9PEZI|nr:CDC25-like phosphatase YCH1 [Golovinomyces cichoracearum]
MTYCQPSCGSSTEKHAMAISMTIPRIASKELARILLSEIDGSATVEGSLIPSKIAVVDVRDEDYIGGHIKNSINVPSTTLVIAMPELVRKLQDKELVVFHCALSQQRGPRAALHYLRERDKLSESPGQNVFILDQGFVGWQREFGEDTRLTEGFKKQLWL